MSDLTDRAQERDQQLRDQALERARGQLPQGESALTCADCGEPIPQARRQALPGVRTCADCQELRERRNR